MLEDSVEPNKKGRGLMIISTAVIVYVAAGGQLKSKMYIVGGLAHFERPYVLELVALTLLAYFLVRFATPRWLILERSIDCAKLYMSGDPRFREKAIEAGKQQRPKGEVSFDPSRPVGRAHRHKVTVWREDGQFVVPVRGLSQNNSHQRKPVPIDGAELVWPAIKAAVLTILFQDAFREDVLPFVLAGIAVVCAAGRIILGW